ncbi:hypothetical protein [Rhizobium freirei]|uniref:hypothetical protein n=1 Tax=Rhizobium freirei TaxID=1353277 RepID=UPI0012F76357|nr:hypothetical protein [Rhizobium freirei]
MQQAFGYFRRYSGKASFARDITYDGRPEWRDHRPKHCALRNGTPSAEGMLQALTERLFTFPLIRSYLFSIGRAVECGTGLCGGRRKGLRQGLSGESDGMVLVDWALRGLADMDNRCRGRARKSRYEPWIVHAMESFEREMVVFYRRSQFRLVRTNAG